ncbi:hypothetical protein K32_01470 [Kaistia sp. 32K]|uniref:hypothetical protein n=1 Tax=Kaistia sp. 32K TaxID=2795690 RepID=UPI0019151685|nr:hypothetical protein [Kaistia sp. 32K]BCP51530.1 hypothetical protein K32_01470 [Kaistia sp. 32K]
MASFNAVETVRRFVALLVVVASLVLMPGGWTAAQAMPDHGGVSGCPHSVLQDPGGAPAHKPIGLPTMPQCCYALPTFALVGVAGQAMPVLAGDAFRPLSDAMPTPLAIGPDVPPPRA